MLQYLTPSAVLIVFFAASGSARAHAQQATNCGTAGGVVITGRIVNAKTGGPVAGSRVHLLVPLCNGSADDDGRFRFEGVRPGVQRLDTGHAGYRDFKSVSHTVAAGDSLDVKLLLEPGGPIEDCLADASCARLLQDPPGHLTDEEALRLLALGAGIAIAWQRVGQQQPWWACVNEQNATIIDELTKRYQDVADHKVCGARAHIMFSINRGGEGWDCAFDRTAKGWQPVLCELIVQS